MSSEVGVCIWDCVPLRRYCHAAMQNLEHPVKARLLVVDADEAVRKALKRVLESVGCEVLLAEDAPKGARVLAAEPVDLAVVDLDTFCSDGESLFEQLRKPEPGYPILVLARVADAAVREEAAQLGRFLVKPVDGRLLLDSVAVLLKTPRQRWSAAKLEMGEAVLRRLQTLGAGFSRGNLPYRPLYH